MRTVNPALKRSLRARAHSLKPVVTVADRGLHETLLEETRKALDHHELIKVRIRQERAQRAETAVALCEQTGAALIQSIGQIVAIYKPRPAESKVEPGLEPRNSRARAEATRRAGSKRPSDKVRKARQFSASSDHPRGGGKDKPWDSPTDRKRARPSQGSRRQHD